MNKDWEFSAVYGTDIYNNSVYSNLYLISLGKRIGSNYFYARYTPGISSKFVINTGIEVIINDTTDTRSLSNSFEYKEIFGLGYSYTFSENFSMGFSLRHLQQKIEEDILDIFYDSESTPYFVPVTTTSKKDFWLGDIGITYSYQNRFSLSVQSVNLLAFKEPNITDEYYYDLSTDKKAIFGLNYYPIKNLSFQTYYETDKSYSIGIHGGLETELGNFSFGINALHNNNIDELISSMMPTISYNNDFINLAIIGSFLLQNDNTSLSKSDFQELGIDNILNNRYSNDRVLLSMNLALSFKPEKKVKFLTIDFDEQIFPSLAENYLTVPFANAKVVNLTNEIVSVKPASYINNLNSETIYSPIIKINPNDTAVVPFYTVIADDFEFSKKRSISNVNFSLLTENEEPDDLKQSPILINSKNSWDGKIINLKHFVNNELSFAADYSKQILSIHKNEIESTPSELEKFISAKIIFNNFAKQMLYVSDPRSAVEYVQFPSETLDIKGGDCDDLTVCMAALLESIGIESAFIDYKNEEGISHVSLLINTKLNPSNSSLITNNDKKIFIRKSSLGNDEIWIPIETTSFQSFESSWEIGAKQFHEEAVKNYGLVKNKVEIIDIY